VELVGQFGSYDTSERLVRYSNVTSGSNFQVGFKGRQLMVRKWSLADGRVYRVLKEIVIPRGNRRTAALSLLRTYL